MNLYHVAAFLLAMLLLSLLCYNIIRVGARAEDEWDEWHPKK